MDRRRGASRIFRTSVDKENEGERYYSALGGEATYSGIFGGDVPRSMEISDRIRFQSPESIVLEDLPRPGILSQFHHNEDHQDTESRFYTPLHEQDRESIKTESRRRGSLPRGHNIFESLEEWNVREIPMTFKGLSPLQIQVLEGAWKGQMDRLHEAVVRTKESKKGINYAHLIINHHDSTGRTPLHFASAFGHSQIVQFLLQEGALVNVWDRMNKVTPLGCACACGSLPVVEILLAHKADVNAGNGRCLTPLHWSVRSGSPECLKKLLGAGANVNSINIEVGTPLHLAASQADEKCMKVLVEHRANVGLCRDNELWTALHIAVNEGSTECVELLLHAGANIEVKDGREQTPLHISANNGDSEMTGLLLTWKGNPGAKDCDGRTPLHKAVSKGYESAECLLLLLEYSADIDAQDNYGHTPLHLGNSFTLARATAINDSSFSASYLLQEGADVTLRTKGGQSGLSLLVKKMPHVIRHIRESLDNAVTINNIDPTDPECELKLDFRAMIANPSNKPSTNSQRSKNTNPERAATLDDMQRETEFLTCLIKTGYKSYLSHPLVESFIVLKWERVRVFFWISLLFYATMVLLYSIYVYEVFVEWCPFSPSTGNASTHNQTCELDEYAPNYLSKREKIEMSAVWCGELADSIPMKVIWFLLCLVLAIITTKELFQMIQGFHAYFMIFEHYFQWLLLGTIFMAVFPAVPITGMCLQYYYYPSAAIGILVAWSLMLVRIGRFPALGIYVQMLVKVIQNFGLFISAYCCLIVAFAFAFAILFHDEPPFSSIQRSILKTVTMMVGELNYDDLFYQKVLVDGIEQEKLKVLNYPVTAHVLFAGFVVFMTIIMMNLLVGLAVHDIQSLEKGAKAERLLRQTASISGLESFLFSKGLHAILPTSLGKFLRKRALLVPSSYKWTFYFRPNDPRDRRLPKELVREALCLANNRQQLGKRPSYAKNRQNTVRSRGGTFRFDAQLENMEKRLRDGYKKDLETILGKIESTVQNVTK